MRHYTFLECEKKPRGEATYLVVGAPKRYQFSDRLGPLLSRLRKTYSEVFPDAPAMRLGIVVEERNGASGCWSIAQSALVGPTFVIETDPQLESTEAIFAHELVHPLVRLLGVPTATSIAAIDPRIGDEFTSTAHHPYVFDLLEALGYQSEQREQYIMSARGEMAKLASADWASATYTAPPGQTWLALWYFNFYLLARQEYDALYELHGQHAPGVTDKMNAVRDSWMSATRNTGTLKRSAGVRQIRAFQSELHRRLDLEGRVAYQPLDSWGRWLFQGM